MERRWVVTGEVRRRGELVGFQVEPIERAALVEVRRWSCPHHPDGPPTLPADGWEREELGLEDAYEPAEVAGLLAAWRADPENVGLIAVGACCLEPTRRWRTVGRRWARAGATVSVFADLLQEMRGPLMEAYGKPSILAGELRR